MFHPERWAAAFVEVCGKDLGEGIAALKVFTACTAGMTGLVTGDAAAVRLEKMLRKAAKEAGFGANNRGAEFAVRFMILLVQKKQFRYREAILKEIERLADRINGLTRVKIESVSPPDEEFQEKIKTALKHRTGAKEIVLGARIVPELLGGYRLFIGTELSDTSLRGQLKKMAADLQIGAAMGNIVLQRSITPQGNVVPQGSD
jgi:F-type H+-transporting ATPase subunit delta